MGKKSRQDVLLEQIKILDLIVVDSNEFYNIKSNSDKVTLKDEEGYLYLCSIETLKNPIRRNNKNLAKFFARNTYTYENINHYLKRNKKSFTLISKKEDLTNAITNLIWYCPKHDIEFKMSWNSVKNGSGCPTCGKTRAAKKRRNKYSDIKNGFEEQGYLLVSKDYINNEKPLEYICLKHKDKGIQKISWGNLITGQKCLYCTKENYTQQMSKTHDEFLEQIYAIHKDKFVFIDEYVNSKTKIKTYCKDCSTEFYASPCHLLEGHLGCNCRSRSLGERLIKEWLDENNIDYIQEYRIKECRNKKPLPFDFAIFEDNNKTKLKMLIEFQGKQHYHNTSWTSDAKESSNIFEQRIKNDGIKRQYCINNGISLLEIPYWNIHRIDNILKLNCNN